MAGAPMEVIYNGCGGQIQGVSPGWEDIYEATFDGQELDISELPDGRYAVRITADPDNQVPELDKSNNSIVVYIEIADLQVDVLPGPLESTR